MSERMPESLALSLSLVALSLAFVALPLALVALPLTLVALPLAFVALSLSLIPLALLLVPSTHRNLLWNDACGRLNAPPGGRVDHRQPTRLFRSRIISVVEHR
jgi:hypothetical protein